MFGVLVVKNQNNQLGYLAGFSGRIADSYHLSFFVPPIYDLKESSGFFLREEECISNLNEKIENLLSDENYTFLLVAHQLNLADDGSIDLINELYDYSLEYGYGFYCLTSSPEEDIELWKENTGAGS